MVSLQCEVSTEALISDLELTRVSVDRFTAETTNLTDGNARIGSVSQGYSNPASTDPFKNVILSSNPSLEFPNLEQTHAASPRARLLLRLPSAGSVLSTGPAPTRTVVLRSDAGASSDGLSVGPACIRLVRVGPGRMSCLPCGRLPPHAAVSSTGWDC